MAGAISLRVLRGEGRAAGAGPGETRAGEACSGGEGPAEDRREGEALAAVPAPSPAESAALGLAAGAATEILRETPPAAMAATAVSLAEAGSAVAGAAVVSSPSVLAPATGSLASASAGAATAISRDAPPAAVAATAASFAAAGTAAAELLSTRLQSAGAVPARAAAGGGMAAASPAGGRLAAALRRQLPGLLLGLVSIGLLVGFWYLATAYRWNFYIRFTNVPTPGEVFSELVALAGDGKFLTNIGISLQRILLGFAFATVLGVVFGLLCGRYLMLRRLLFPALEVLRPIPAIAWVPISIMLWPSTESSIVFITFLGAFFPILLNTLHGVAAVDAVLLRAARCLGAGEASLLARVILPAALPHIFTGLAVGMGVAWVSLIAAEMISGQFGVGYFTWEAYSLIEYPHIVIGMLVIGVLGLACSGAIRLLSRIAMPWQSLGGREGAP
ncbi:ABC transporter permease [Azoarcus sp. TTM-91]|uniref:ABC transporter permease n=1 Tax=Azoarcus sp. TTM-91 TaxID=2691581 RepID=UPI001B7D19E9|nr:ABC transporter permease [Azoarcus sp. TTM-91]